ncbi:glycoside hydrolase [Hesseltinella vesiculosa]|uniref:Probable beta-glucosidase G n=1 Tax=Hesseltinella vesiculosa TaxID=101127 RepID=A0A1X2G5Y3_9FUNG|nr:glycoside hydrolase [Hesseltinella vesiculosa]
MHLCSIAFSSLLIVQGLSLVAAQRSWEEAYSLARPLIDQMSLEQKVNMTTGMGWTITPCVGNSHPITNPDFPSMCYQDSPLGVRMAHNVTAWPAGITAAATFDRRILNLRGVGMAQEFREKGVHVQLGPAINFMRTPQGGRGFESFGEDPFLTGACASETVIGIQSQGVIATAKHFILNDQELNRNTASSNVDDRTLHEIYLWPFARAVESGCAGVMCAYNLVNGSHACEDKHTLSLLKNELGFQGFVTSDWWATHSTVESANHGMDVDMPGNDMNQDDPYSSSFWGRNLTKAVKNGSVDETRVTDMALRVAAAYFKMKQDTGIIPETKLNSFDLTKVDDSVNVKTPQHTRLARAIAAAGTVLLANDGILPLTRHDTSLSIIGSDAFMSPLLNDPEKCSDFGCDPATLIQGWGSGTVTFADPIIAPYQGLKERAGSHVKFETARDNWDLDAVAKTAAASDIAIVFANADSGEEYLTVDGNKGDRNNLTLWNNGDAIITTTANNNKNTIVVIHSVGAVTMPWIDHPNIKAVVWANLPGEQSGHALADVMFGDINPSGRLPYTIAKKAEDYGAVIGTGSNIDYTEKLLLGYRWFDEHKIDPLFPFGHGLSYTTFLYNDLEVHTHRASEVVSVSVHVTNVGHFDGHEVVQLYLDFPDNAGEPPKVLRGFDKIYIRAGMNRKVHFDLTKTELSIWDTDSQQWVIPSGTFRVMIGASSRDIRAVRSFRM